MEKMILALFSFDGRVSRTVYFFLYELPLGILVTILDLEIWEPDSIPGGITVISLLLCLSYLSICGIVKRLHDLNRPGSHLFLGLVPFYNLYLGFLLLFRRGTIGMNQYGADPFSYYYDIQRRETEAVSVRVIPKEEVRIMRWLTGSQE